MTYTVADAYRAIDAVAPFETAAEFDNVGLLVGKMDRPVDTILTAVDATLGVVEEARALGAQLLVTHHPLLFTPLRRLDESVPEAALLCEMVRVGVSMIAAHTNLDIAPGGINDTMIDMLGWPAADTAIEFSRGGKLSAPQRLADIAAHAEAVFGAPVLLYGNPDTAITRYALCSGSGGSQVANAAQTGAQLLLTGEIKHDQLLEAMARGLCVLACGHRATELCGADLLARHLQSDANAVELKVRVFVSKVDPFA